jgi:hypothetical protein
MRGISFSRLVRAEGEKLKEVLGRPIEMNEYKEIG